MIVNLPHGTVADISDFNNYADEAKVLMTNEGIIISFYRQGEEYISISKTYDEWIEDEQERVQDIIDALARHPSDYVQGIANLQVIDGGGNHS